jgi:hypothetical protein
MDQDEVTEPHPEQTGSPERIEQLAHLMNVWIERSGGKNSGQTVAAFVESVAGTEPPLLVWGEPEAAPSDKPGLQGRIAGFTPLALGAPAWPADVKVTEARLFWATASLHAVADGSGCRWARVEELPGDHSGRELAGRKTLDTVFHIERVWKSRKRVLTLRDLVRFGLSDAEFHTELNQLDAIEYWLRGRLAGWRLVPADNSSVKDR